MGELAIIFTGDMHNRLTPEAATRLRSLTEEHDAILLDGGDAISAGNVWVRPGDEPILALMNQAGYDAMVLGNREYHFTRSGMFHKIGAAHFPVLAANIELGDAPGPIKPWTILESAGGRVGILGLAREMVQPGVWWQGIVATRFIDWSEAAETAVRQIAGEVDLLVALSHLGREFDRALALQRPEIDLILGGHEHPAELITEQLDGGCLAVYVPAFAQQAAVVKTSSHTRPYDFQVTAVKLK